jgi:hypothetical protein
MSVGAKLGHRVRREYAVVIEESPPVQRFLNNFLAVRIQN